MALLQYRSFIIKHLTENFEADINTLSQITDHVLSALQMKINELPAPKSPPKRRSGYNILSNLLNSEQDDQAIALIQKIGHVTLSRQRDYATKTASKVKTIDDEIFTTYDNLNDAYAAAKSQALAGFALTAFVWANLEKHQKEFINNFAIGNSIKDPLPKTKNSSPKRKGGHNCIKTVIAQAISKNNPLVLALLKLPEYTDKEKGREVGQQLWKQIKDNLELTDKWHIINDKLPKGQKERKNTVDSDPEFFNLLEESIKFVLP